MKLCAFLSAKLAWTSYWRKAARWHHPWLGCWELASRQCLRMNLTRRTATLFLRLIAVGGACQRRLSAVSSFLTSDLH